jgi:hypothetical protein
LRAGLRAQILWVLVFVVSGCGGPPAKPPPAQPASASIQVVIPTQTPALDQIKYPQDTPEKALTSIVQSLSFMDIGYWFSWQIRPQDSKWWMDKYGGIEKLVRAKSNEKSIVQFVATKQFMQLMQKTNQTSQGVENGASWFRFHNGKTVVQFEKQSDGRWCMNPYVKVEEDPVLKDAPPAAPDVPRGIPPRPNAPEKPPAPNAPEKPPA